jgi:predicted DNA-binding mobile mystery protein A
MPSRKNLPLVRQQLDKTLTLFDSVLDLAPPSRGWIRAVRGALGMSGRQLARRLGLTQQSVARMEKDEVTGALTIKTLRRVAESLDCVLVYGIVPRENLESIVHDRARTIAHDRQDMVDDLVDRMPANFWDTK